MPPSKARIIALEPYNWVSDANLYEIESMKKNPLIRLFSLLTLGLFTSLALSAESPTTSEKIAAALKDERRSPAEIDRDKNRKPLETLEFFRLKDDMTVLEIMPGGGWYTTILGPVLAERGRLLLTIGAERTAERLIGQPGFESTELIPFDRSNITRSTTSRAMIMPAFSLGVKKVDLALTFRNLHNLTPEARQHMNKAVFDTLKKGGMYGVVDHTRRHMQGDSTEVWRRLDPVLAIQEIQAAGFQLLDYSDLHYRPDDELRYEVGRKSVTGNTDRFTLLFVKP